MKAKLVRFAGPHIPLGKWYRVVVNTTGREATNYVTTDGRLKYRKFEVKLSLDDSTALLVLWASRQKGMPFAFRDVLTCEEV